MDLMSNNSDQIMFLSDYAVDLLLKKKELSKMKGYLSQEHPWVGSVTGLVISMISIIIFHYVYDLKDIIGTVSLFIFNAWFIRNVTNSMFTNYWKSKETELESIIGTISLLVDNERSSNQLEQ